jgi:hypothetical protein
MRISSLYSSMRKGVLPQMQRNSFICSLLKMPEKRHVVPQIIKIEAGTVDSAKSQG